MRKWIHVRSFGVLWWTDITCGIYIFTDKEYQVVCSNIWVLVMCLLRGKSFMSSTLIVFISSWVKKEKKKIFFFFFPIPIHHSLWHGSRKGIQKFQPNNSFKTLLSLSVDVIRLCMVIRFIFYVVCMCDMVELMFTWSTTTTNEWNGNNFYVNDFFFFYFHEKQCSPRVLTK